MTQNCTFYGMCPMLNYCSSTVKREYLVVILYFVNSPISSNNSLPIINRFTVSSLLPPHTNVPGDIMVKLYFILDPTCLVQCSRHF